MFVYTVSTTSLAQWLLLIVLEWVTHVCEPMIVFYGSMLANKLSLFNLCISYVQALEVVYMIIYRTIRLLMGHRVVTQVSQSFKYVLNMCLAYQCYTQIRWYLTTW